MVSEDARRLEAAFDRHYRTVLGYALRRVRNVDDAQDIAEATFTTAWRRIDRLPDEPATVGWLLDIARRHVSNHWRSHQRVARRLRAVLAKAPRAEVEDDYRSAEEGGSQPLLLRSFRQLSPGHQEVLRLIYWDELGHGEAAAALGCTRNAFDNRLSRAHAALRRLLDATGRDLPVEDKP